MADLPPVALASASPRRAALLRGLGIEPRIVPSEIDESPVQGETAERYVSRMAASKLDAAIPRFAGEDGPTIVIAADTSVVLDDRIIGKPADRAHAAAILDSLSGRMHRVLTAVAIGVCSGDVLVERHETVQSTAVTFRSLSMPEIEAYIATGEPMDKAGAYGIQGRARSFVEQIDGSRTNVIGLPTEWVSATLDEL